MALSTPIQRFTFSIPAAIAVAVLLLAPGCDPTVDILTPSDQYRYSLFGALNVAADTQIIRVEPLGDTTQIGAPPTLNATVLLENLDTGEQVSLRDSLATVGARDVQVHNLWTTYPISPATSYRVTVQEDGETITTATTTTPTRAPTLSRNGSILLPCLFPTTPGDQRRAPNTFVVTAQDVDRIAAADVIYPITYMSSEGPIRTRNDYSHYNTIEKVAESSFRISVFYRQNLENLNPDPPPGPMRACAGFEEFTYPYAFMAVASGGPNWPEEWRGLPFDRITSPDSFSNVQGGHGFVAGVYSDTIRVPLETRR